jgi:hypothetical protein
MPYMHPVMVKNYGKWSFHSHPKPARTTLALKFLPGWSVTATPKTSRLSRG